MACAANWRETAICRCTSACWLWDHAYNQTPIRKTDTTIEPVKNTPSDYGPSPLLLSQGLRLLQLAPLTLLLFCLLTQFQRHALLDKGPFG